MPLTNDEVFRLACDAVKAMHKEHGDDFKFPADLIWEYVPRSIDIPGTQKPHQPRRLIKEGLLEKTGGMTSAYSEKRAQSPTTEYRFGPRLVVRSVAREPDDVVDRPSASAAIKGIQSHMEAEGYVISSAELANFVLAMMVSPLVILSGISGTGKSLLPRKFAKYTGSHFKAIPVQPQWSDNSDLFGYVPSLSPDRYVKGALIDSMLDAKKNPDTLVLALLDEMNLAPVEHYFSDFLSVAETRTRKQTEVVTDELPIELPLVVGGADPYVELRGIRLPANLRVVGTANMDETTHTFSPKVLDRAFTIEFDDPDLTTFAAVVGPLGNVTFPHLAEMVIRRLNAISVHEAWPRSQDIFEEVSGLLGEVQDVLAPAGIKFGYRTRDAILLYLHFWRELGLQDVLSAYAALDFCILQKILPKLSGTGESLAESLRGLENWLEGRAQSPSSSVSVRTDFAGPLARSLQKVKRMGKLLDLDGSTRFWGA